MNYQQALNKLSSYQQKRVTRNIAKRYCLLKLKCMKENDKNTYSVKLTDKNTVRIGEYLLEAREVSCLLNSFYFNSEIIKIPNIEAQNNYGKSYLQ